MKNSGNEGEESSIWQKRREIEKEKEKEWRGEESGIGGGGRCAQMRAELGKRGP